ncbi:type II secretion system minor pseudopilin GspI [Scandinavium sp. V105_16]|uniref:Type II secretion system protein I n=1 Tax=Scandinavium lactucae TaxID=3095028 RepID=A0AAJ2SAH3_9ENTR|nr:MULTISPECIES: type II secretion system minor pseudopilin GspI [unclassified Scandinavium]MDX6019495.1 type II secretion system minor pseudopilin GspI [Scandinavium sp. V105_16]MDX6032751.1 type II secretion system minor pseudopilin GspI [Scandinavium sp. V105_12]MDX6040024.1 type II secretion system minor pseudopilin GspI [Scandinavium sp. V105_6]MDX6048581.1 type II secretion system minor pseudopilin GspI [Scandinavium sp. V105_1]
MKTEHDGFTILEVLLAMVIFAAVSMTLISSINGQLSATATMRDNVFATWVADNVLTTLALANSSEAKTQHGSMLMGGSKWEWTLEVGPSDVESMTRWQVQVPLENGQHVQLERYVMEPENAAQP